MDEFSALDGAVNMFGAELMQMGDPAWVLARFTPSEIATLIDIFEQADRPDVVELLKPIHTTAVRTARED